MHDEAGDWRAGSQDGRDTGPRSWPLFPTSTTFTDGDAGKLADEGPLVQTHDGWSRLGGRHVSACW